ncbi:hypothetical protein Mal4_29830 [Maioricimonas rarisocia]|uniref:Uncharacterized protein n=1 Tax=Maioricimonas rarisocia TaxID=2528026 RepID=A0A517Z865_9PLAN|nr:hypothetical protein [Maioricimonas rarisocia]QDU38653.1 hypothetical protein Mal4_29830 [Maioricimonas rarisocia]
MGHRTDESDADRSRRSGGIIPAVHLIVWGLLVAWLLLGVPRYSQMFADFGIEVSSTSMLAIQLADFATVFWPVLLAGLIALAVVSYVIDDGLARAGSVLFRSAWLLLGVTLPLITTAVTYLALERNLATLIENFS